MYNNYNFIFWDDELINSTKILSYEINDFYTNDYNVALKTDLIRFQILSKIGGIYVDIDTEPIRKMPDEFLKYKFFAGYQPNNEVNIALMGSQPYNDLALNYTSQMLTNIKNNQKIHGFLTNEIWKITGPEAFTDFLKPYFQNDKFKFFPTEYFYPYSWLEKNKKNNDFHNEFPNCYSVHHWDHEWI